MESCRVCDTAPIITSPLLDRYLEKQLTNAVLDVCVVSGEYGCVCVVCMYACVVWCIAVQLLPWRVSRAYGRELAGTF